MYQNNRPRVNVRSTRDRPPPSPRSLFDGAFGTRSQVKLEALQLKLPSSSSGTPATDALDRGCLRLLLLPQR